MAIDSTNIYIDIIIGVAEFVLLFIFFVKTEKYSAFHVAYYYYLIAAPCFGLMKIFEIILFPKSSIDPTQIDFAESDNTELPINRKSQILQILEIFQLLLLSLLIILPTLIELIFGFMSIVMKYILTKNVSANDLYVISFIPTFLSVLPLCLKEIKSSPPSNIFENTHKNYVLFVIILYTLVGIALNTLVLISGGLIGLNIYNNFVL